MRGHEGPVRLAEQSPHGKDIDPEIKVARAMRDCRERALNELPQRPSRLR